MGEVGRKVAFHQRGSRTNPKASGGSAVAGGKKERFDGGQRGLRMVEGILSSPVAPRRETI